MKFKLTVMNNQQTILYECGRTKKFDVPAKMLHGLSEKSTKKQTSALSTLPADELHIKCELMFEGKQRSFSGIYSSFSNFSSIGTGSLVSFSTANEHKVT